MITFFIGPDNTPYAGGKFVVDIKIPPNYPFEPPKMQFDTKIWHPNISSVTGAICLDVCLVLQCCHITIQHIVYHNYIQHHTDHLYFTYTIVVIHCLQILKNEWSPALTLRTAMLSLQALLSTPNPDDPQDAQVAGQYKNFYSEWEKKASEWTKIYAKDKRNNPDVINRLKEMGFDEKKVIEALNKNNWDEQQAAEYLLTNV